jgi:hypothetical protein
MPTNVFPAPHGSTIIPDRARLSRDEYLNLDSIESKKVPITKHFAETGFLIWTNDSRWFEVDVKIGIDGVVSEIIFL